MRPVRSLFRVLAPAAAASWLVACPLTTEGPPAPPGPPTEDPWRPLIDASLLHQFTPRIQWQHGQPRNVFVDVSVPASVPADPVARALWFLDAHAGVYGFADVANDLFLRRTEVRGDTAHVFFGQLLGGREVFASDVIVHLVGDHVRSTTLVRSAGPAVFDPPAVDAPRAQFIASRGQGTGPGQPVGTPRLVVFDRAVLDPASPSSARLAWDVTVEDSAAGKTWTTFVDASTAVVLLTLGWEVNHGAPSASVDFYHEACLKRSPPFTLSECMAEPPSLPVETEAEVSTYGRLLYPTVGALREHYLETYAFFHDRYGRHGWDDTDARKDVRYVFSHENASYSRSDDTLRFGYGHQIDDVVGHEFTHAIDRWTADLIPDGQAGALKESVADILAACIDSEDWLIGEDYPGTAFLFRPSEVPFRSLQDPRRFGQPAYMSEYMDGADIHVNGGITNHAAYLMATNRLGGIGKEKLAQITFDVLTTSLPQAATFQDFACYSIAQASAYERTSAHGFVPTDLGAIAGAFASVGLPASECDPFTAAAGADRDWDLWPDTDDNCPDNWNLGQEDLDGDGPGNLCDPDPDGDGWCSPGLGPLPAGTVGAVPGCTGSDNCPLTANADQRNDDGDRLGEVCDDDDLDFVFNTDDNCPQVPNRDQRDGDSDDIGDACDNDRDRDCVPSRGFPDVPRTCEAADVPGTCAASCLADPAFECTTGCTDNCPDVANVDQAESDGDLHGDACDLCQGMVNVSNADLDGDTLGDECDVDDDGDEVNDDIDVCPRVHDPLQARLPNGDGLACTDLDEILAAGQYLFDWRDLASDLRLQIPFVPCLVDGPGCFGWPDLDALTELEVTLGQPLKGVLAYVVDDRGARIATLEPTDKGFRGAFRPAADAHYLSPFKTDGAKLYEGTRYAVEFVLPAGLSAKSIEAKLELLTPKLPTQ